MPTNPDQDLPSTQSEGVHESGRNRASDYAKITFAAQRLAIHFTEEANLPLRLRKSVTSAQPRKINVKSEAEKRFNANVKLWTDLIETMLGKISSGQAWRFVGLSPEISPTIRRVTDCEDFGVFVDYLILRRDTEKCGADELGGLALLLTAFQHEIEKHIS